MDINVNEFLRRKKADQHLHIRNQQEKAPSNNPGIADESSSGSSCAVKKVGEKRQRNEYAEICNTENCSVEHNSSIGSNGNGDDESVQSKSSECSYPKFNDFDKLREDANFAVGQTWALYNTADGMPRLNAHIRKVSAPCFGLLITYLEPDSFDKKERLWFQQNLPVSVGTFRLGKSQNTKDRSIFSHVIHCNERSYIGGFRNDSHFIVSPRKGETWALFKSWDIKWSSEPDSHRKYEYEFVEILSDYADEAVVYVAYLHKAKGFASVFFRMGTGYEGIFRILPHSLYRFSHKVPSFKLTGMEGEGVPKDAYELDQAALPETIEEIIVPLDSESNIKPQRQTIYFASKGKVFQTGQIWSCYNGYDGLPLYYGRIQKISFTQAFEQEAVLKLHLSRLKATPFPADLNDWVDRKMPVGCGTYYARKALEIITPDDVSCQVMPKTSLDGIEYTILPKIGEVWVIYRNWSIGIEVEDLEDDFGLYDIVEILDDTLEYKVQLLDRERIFNDDEDEVNMVLSAVVEKYKYDWVGWSAPISTFPKSERLRFANKVPACRVTKETFGELKVLLSVELRALPSWLNFPTH